MDNNRASKYIALLLRHHPEAAGLHLDSHGWADVESLIAGVARKFPGFRKEDLEKIVQTDSKQRYAFSDDKRHIRANQGHSLSVDVGLKKAVPPEMLYHGTAVKSKAAIEKEGLRAQGRLYIHLSRDAATAKTVGARHGRPIVYSIDTVKMTADGYEFFLSANGVWLTEVVPPKYLHKI